MKRVKFGEVVKRININVDRFNTDRLYYIGKGATIEPDALTVEPQGRINATLGFKFHFGFNPGHILFMSRCFDQHKAATATFYGICSDSTYVVETKDESVLLQRYLQLEMQSNRFWQWCEEHKSGGVNYLINYSTLTEYEFDLPPIEEQKLRAEKLWAAYEVKQSYLKMIKATQEMVQSQFIEMFGTIERPKVEVKELLDVVCESGQYGSNTSATNYIEGTPRYIRITDIDDDGSLNEDIKSAEICDYKFILQKDDIVFARTGATVGKTYLHEEGEAIYAGYLIKYHPKESVIRPRYLKAFTHSSTYYNWVNKTQKIGAQPNISAAQYDKMPVLVPSLDEQDEYLEIYNQADKSEFELKKSIEAIDAVIKSLINS